MDNNDPFLARLYDRLHDSLNQQKFRHLAPMPIGVVFLQWPEMTEEDIRGHFRLMKQLGFNALKQIMTCPGTTIARIQHMALDEGIIPWWYGEGGWEAITNELLDKLDIPQDTPISDIRRHPRMVEYQTRLLRERIDGKPVPPVGQSPIEPYDTVPHTVGVELEARYHARFVEWLKQTYGTVETLNDAWNLRHVGIAKGGAPWTTWNEVAENWAKLGTNEYRHLRDILRFKADEYLRAVRLRTDQALTHDRNEPVRAGGEMGLFLPFAARATDMEGIAEEMARGGSFYPSIHLAWHFEEVDFEMARTVYMQASIAADWFKGGWSATWESTGGPQQLSGGKAWDRESALKTAGFTVDAGTITQLLLSYVAGGFRGVGMWCWNPRSAGWEAGEYSLLDRNMEPTPRAIRAGQIGQAMVRLRDELWQARKEPLVGVFQDWDNEAIWACISVPNRDKYKHVPIHARIGASRALINSNVPWEHVTASDLRNGLAGRYRVIYLPAVMGLSADLLPLLRGYVESGGRVVLDMPGAWYDTFGRLLPTGKGSDFEALFGATLDDFQYASNVPRSIDGMAARGFVSFVTPTSARAVATFDDGRRPAVTEHVLGSGTAVLLAYEASLMCFRPGDQAAETLLLRHTLGQYGSPYACADAVVYRLAAPAADHYFFINNGPARAVTLNTKSFHYRAAADPVTEETLDLNAPIALEAYSGRWLRCEK